MLYRPVRLYCSAKQSHVPCGVVLRVSVLSDTGLADALGVQALRARLHRHDQVDIEIMIRDPYSLILKTYKLSNWPVT